MPLENSVVPDTPDGRERDEFLTFKTKKLNHPVGTVTSGRV